MQLVEIDPIRPKGLETSLDGTTHVAGRCTAGELIVRLVPELGGQHDVVAPPTERGGTPLLAGEIRVGRVEEVDPRLECGIDDWQDLSLRHGEAEVVRPQPDDRDRERADGAMQHGGSLSESSGVLHARADHPRPPPEPGRHRRAPEGWVASAPAFDLGALSLPGQKGGGANLPSGSGHFAPALPSAAR